MREFEIYLPTLDKDGRFIHTVIIEAIKAELKSKFGGYTHLTQKNEGAWKLGGKTFWEEVTILRILDDGTADFDMKEFKKTIEKSMNQESVLIVEREVEVL